MSASRKDYLKNWRKLNKSVLEETRETVDVCNVNCAPPQEEEVRAYFHSSSQSCSNLRVEENMEVRSSDSPEYLSDSSSDRNSFNSTTSRENLSGDLASWCLEFNCSQAAMNSLLDILRKHGNMLPKDARTLLKVPQEVQFKSQCVQKCGGTYYYFRLEAGIKKNLTGSESEISLSFNIDGLPLFKSSNTQFWPILCEVGGGKIFIVAIYTGEQKPSSLGVFLDDFLKELCCIKLSGITIKSIVLYKIIWYNNKIVHTVKVRAFLCDVPARSFLKGTVGHTGYFSCERCIIKGSWEGRVVFNKEQEFRKRTDEDFSCQSYKKHQKYKSPLIAAGIKCVSGFCLDYMYLICLGTVKRILKTQDIITK
ncbi:uncharacterized protein LOC124808768 [Hydra vulgaris]|uniref:uncharacterized protein LOC124808768 n=1 Tax=Hydra vulgaris TaxID=6087 RepID=UPI0032EA70FF